MWDARFEAMRDRKLNELVIFAAMVRTDPANRREYLSIIAKIGKDLDVIEALAEGGKVPESKPITSELYRRRLSKYELLDEYCLDACRSGDLSKMRESQRLEAPEVQSRIDSPEVLEKIEAPEEQSRIEAPEEQSRIEAPEEKPSIDAPEEKQRLEPPEKVQMIDGPSGDPDSTFVMLVPIEDAVTLKKARAMKDGKIDFFIDAEISGRFKEAACEDVISFLKTDLNLIDLILSINIRSKKDIEEKISAIIELVEKADEPKYQKVYLNSLNQDEKALEGSYNMVLKRFEETLKNHYSYLIEEKGSLFFE